MFCEKCGSNIPDDAIFCPKCGAKQEVNAAKSQPSQQAQPGNGKVLAQTGATELKCPGCGAPIKPQFGEMIITCEYCGSSISLANAGWKSISKHTMLPISLATRDQATADLRSKMDKGLLHRHLQEQSTLEDLSLSYVPYWVVPVSSRTNYTAVDAAAEVGTIAATAAIMGLAGGAMGGRGGGGGLGIGLVEGTMMGGMMSGGMGGGGTIRAYQLNENYNYPVVGVKALTQYQPRDYAFDLSKRVDFDATKIPKGTKTLNGDVGEDASEYEAKAYVGQIQAAKAHAKHHMIRSINTQSDTGEPELLHAPIWFARYQHKGKNIVLVLDASSGGVINSIGID